MEDPGFRFIRKKLRLKKGINRRPAFALASARQAYTDIKDKSFRQDLQDVQDISRPLPPIKSGVTRGAEYAEKIIYAGSALQDTRIARKFDRRASLDRLKEWELVRHKNKRAYFCASGLPIAPNA